MIVQIDETRKDDAWHANRSRRTGNGGPRPHRRDNFVTTLGRAIRTGNRGRQHRFSCFTVSRKKLGRGNKIGLRAPALAG
jgi:hypothetical protein